MQWVHELDNVGQIVHELRAMLTGPLDFPHVCISLPTETADDVHLTLAVMRVAGLHENFLVAEDSVKFVLESAVCATRAIAVFEITRFVFPEQASFAIRHEHDAATALRTELSELIDTPYGTATSMQEFCEHNVV